MSTSVRRAASRLAWVLWLTAALSLLVVPAASAYIDPGSGSIVFQALIAGAMGASLALKVYWRRLTGVVGRLFGRSAPAGEPEEANAAAAESGPGTGSGGDTDVQASDRPR